MQRRVDARSALAHRAGGDFDEGREQVFEHSAGAGLELDRDRHAGRERLIDAVDRDRRRVRLEHDREDQVLRSFGAGEAGRIGDARRIALDRRGVGLGDRVLGDARDARMNRAVARKGEGSTLTTASWPTLTKPMSRLST